MAVTRTSRKKRSRPSVVMREAWSKQARGVPTETMIEHPNDRAHAALAQSLELLEGQFSVRREQTILLISLDVNGLNALDVSLDHAPKTATCQNSREFRGKPLQVPGFLCSLSWLQATTR